MAVRTAWFVGTLIMVTVAGMLLMSPAVHAGTKSNIGSVSPSQESRARINALRANEFFYQSYGKTDPFKVLVAGDYEQSMASDVVDMNSAKLVGVMWGQDDRFALVEDGDGFGYILRVGDRVRSGRIVSIRKDSLTARIPLGSPEPLQKTSCFIHN